MPPLRNRPEDIPLLVGHFLTEFSQKNGKKKQHFSEEALRLLTVYDWPGNVRELRNIIERIVVTRPETDIQAKHLPSRITNTSPPEETIAIPVGSSFSVAERAIIMQTLASVNDNRSRAARILGLSRKTLHNKLKKYAQVT
ncbi:MAG TPA: helix-turn-helix domain-containing protein, partial [Bacteroidota bacterium]|nr:helix-turn-helix domain-containing protein [Bacteroidota bacterium]